MLLDLLQPGGRLGADDFEGQVLASAEAVGHRFRFDRAHGHQVAMLATRLFDELRDEHGLSKRDRLLLQTASILHDVGIYVSLRAHHKHSQYLLAASQIFGLSDDETAVVSNIARYHRGRSPSRAICRTSPGSRRPDPVTKLAAILRVANALDAEHLQKVRDLRLARGEASWVLRGGQCRRHHDGTDGGEGSDGLVHRSVRPPVGDPPGGGHRVTPHTRTITSLFINRELSWLAFNDARPRGSGGFEDPAARTRQVRRDRRVEPRRILHGRVAGLQQSGRGGETSPDLSGLTPSQQLDAVRVRSQAFVAALYVSSPQSSCRRSPSHGIRLLAYSDLTDRSGRRSARSSPRRSAGVDAAGD
jgi:hypothetical protein